MNAPCPNNDNRTTTQMFADSLAAEREKIAERRKIAEAASKAIDDIADSLLRSGVDPVFTQAMRRRP